MSETIDAYKYLISHDPLVIAGFLAIGASALLFFRLYRRLRLIGDRSYAQFTLPIMFVFTIPGAYLRYAQATNASRLPAYFAWICSTLGLVLLVVGLFRL